MRNMETEWFEWWIQGFWLEADASWHYLPFFRLAPQWRTRLSRSHHTAMAHQLRVPDTLPGAPDTRLLALWQADASQRQLMLRLVSEICQQHSMTAALDDEQRLWCLRISKALRPEQWLPSALDFTTEPCRMALALLASLFPVSTWLRLRFCFDSQTVTQLPAFSRPLPGNKLQTLWDAVIWRTQQQNEAAHVEN
ncbi:type III secretion protein HrpD [Kosakonia oryzae]|uniref:type III secretion protein HrpD n=1 Tax=Kosakonia oryzae TaxID=497725 RepID=UPI001D05D216|nr:type III secretion protein HrpD [Kosakonia oryzae]UDJ83229.1 type III secretion protein HrpD [Kosakonia oryzae]